MNNNSFLSDEEIKTIGFKRVGKNVSISRYANFYSPEEMIIGDKVRIDDFAILSGKIKLGDFVHVSAGVLLFSGESIIKVGNHCNISSRSAIYAESDDFSSKKRIGAQEIKKDRLVVSAPVIMHDYSAIGTGSTVMPGCTLNEGSVLGAMSYAKTNTTLSEWDIYAGIPCRRIKKRQ